MEALYAKLNVKYEKLKTRKFAEIDQSGREQEEKFLNYVKIAEDLIEHLKSENDKLQTKLNELNGEMLNVRSSSDEYKRLLIQEREKTKELSGEVERLQNIQQDSDNVREKKRNIENLRMGSSGGVEASSENNSTGYLRKKSRLQIVVAEPYKAIPLNLSMGTDSEERSRLCSSVDDGRQGPQQQAHHSMSVDVLLQTLLESLVGLKLAVANEEERLCLLAVHQSSGYTFSLTWIRKQGEEEKESELLYHVLSFGTIERLALEWMKEDIAFSLNMFPSFLKQLSNVLQLPLFL